MYLKFNNHSSLKTICMNFENNIMGIMCLKSFPFTFQRALEIIREISSIRRAFAGCCISTVSFPWSNV